MVLRKTLFVNLNVEEVFMETKKIKNLIEILNDSNLESLAYKDKDFELTLVKPVANSEVITTSVIENSQVADVKANPQASINSLLVGVFYAKPDPDSEPFVSVGQKVNAGDVVCIIEAMKVMNEIKADKSGIIESVLVNDGDTVDFDQPLFTLK